MYDLILAIHNLMRWIALIFGILALLRCVWGWFSKREWSALDRKVGFYYTLAVDIQLLLGLVLYIFLSPVTRSAFQNMAAMMGNADFRFYALEHVFYMILVIVFAHLASSLSKKAEHDNARFRRSTIFLTLSLLAMLLGMPWRRPLFPWGA